MACILHTVIESEEERWEACLPYGRSAALPDASAGEATRLLHRNKSTSLCCSGDSSLLQLYLGRWISSSSALPNMDAQSPPPPPTTPPPSSAESEGCFFLAQ
ncbi:hypothetical protein PFLUV_G00080890 [Perca fluviatilis]|uniref:Uncharacterized protein n=1 Tax=Perca fluviatilis TaxID=8168 RepID=A0A6A5F6P2_PERFL|nr:hypothetical protein PFLUV_G00080890 [Perca fluviatilis]